ncbi:MAG: YdbH domain-containing protein [Candidatus Omnitrophica bacterium]|jgi:hypothetical protein|nr:YdbH domain-containing protein [Candidatus Omnitrophota bacterium]
MRRAKHILLFILLFIAGTCLSSKPIIIFLVKQQLKKTFINSDISIGSFNMKLPAFTRGFSRLNELSFFAIQINKEKAYDCKVKELKIYFSFPSLWQKSIAKFYLENASININLEQENILDFNQNLSSKPSAFLVESLEFKNIAINLKTKQAILKTVLTAEINPIEQIVNYLEGKVVLLKYQDFQLQGAYLEASQNKQGELSVEKIQYDKVKIENIKSIIRLNNKTLNMNSLSAKIFKGDILGNLSLKIDKNWEYFCHLNFTNIDLVDFIDSFNLQKKIRLDGALVGNISLKGRGKEINILDGGFNALSPGGMLVIKDDKFLETMAKRTGQSLDILAESFKDYYYNSGVIKLSLDKGDLVFHIALEGDKGARNLAITLHDFKLGYH